MKRLPGLPELVITLALIAGADAQAGTAGLTGQYSGTHSLTIYNAGANVVLGTSTTNPDNTWSFDFDAGTFSVADGMLTLGFAYSLGGALALIDNGDGTYTGSYGLTIGPYGPGNTTIKWEITRTGYTLNITTLDADSDGIPGITLAGVMPLPISPVLNGSATLAGADSNGDGISDAVASALGLNPTVADGDTDGDGTTDVVEIGGDVGNPLDTDGDGLIDALEFGAYAGNAEVAKDLAVSNGQTATITTGAGESLSNVRSSAATGGPVRIAFPYGSISYTTSTPLGGSVTVSLEFSSDLPENLVVYKVDSGGAYTLLPATVWTRTGARTLALTLTDGDPATDADGAVNSSVTDPLAVGNNVSGDFDFTERGNGTFGCQLTAGDHRSGRAGDAWLMLLFFAWLALLRRRAAKN